MNMRSSFVVSVILSLLMVLLQGQGVTATPTTTVTSTTVATMLNTTTVKPATRAYFPCLSGWPAPVAALYSDEHDSIRVHEWRWERYPLGVAVWSDGTIIWSLDENPTYMFRAPYAIGYIPETLVGDLLDALESQGFFESPHATLQPCSEGEGYIMSLATNGKGVTFDNPHRGKELTPLAKANWDLLELELRALAKSATVVTTSILSFQERCVTTKAAARGKTGWQGLPGEVRAVWVPTDFLEMSPEKQDLALAALASAGLNTICINTQWRQWVQYPGSNFLLQSPLESTNVLAVDTLVAAVQNKGMRAEAWPEYGFYSSYNKDTSGSQGGLATRYPALAAIDKDGHNSFYNPTYGYYTSLCPANPESHKLLIGLYSEMLELYPFDGLNLDRIRFPNTDFCYCSYCRKQFAEDTGTSLTVFAEGSADWQTWMKWRETQVTTFMRELSSTIRTNFPGRTITACAVPLEEMEAKGQNWPEWVKLGYVDAVVPLIYSASVGMEAAMAAITELVPDQSRVIYGLLPWEGVGDQITKIRQAGARGYSVWHIGTLNATVRDVFDAANIGFGPGPSTLGQPR